MFVNLALKMKQGHHCVMIFLIKIRSFSNSNECNPSVLRGSLVVLGKTVTNETYVHEEVKSRLKPCNTFYSSFLNLMSFSLLSHVVKSK